jgi:hypothetical protein
MSDLEDLREKRRIAWKELSNLTISLRALYDTVDEFKKQWKEAKALYESTDYQLALIDGRFHKEEITPNKQAKPKVDAQTIRELLSEEEINQLLRELKIEVPEVPDPSMVTLEDNQDFDID